MKRYLRDFTVGFVGVVLMTSLGGCLVRTSGHDHRAAKSPGCHPSQYWDGEMCRHKGKGQGARKHDGR